MAKSGKTITKPIVRPLRESECGEVAAILQYYASREVLLWRTQADILAHAESFFVAEESGRLAGCVALQNYRGGLYELRSLAVREGAAGRGIGTALVQGVIAEARRRGARQLFALTTRTGFFRKNGFKPVNREQFPQKVWKDCQLCPRRDCCDEVAVTICFDEKNFSPPGG